MFLKVLALVSQSPFFPTPRRTEIPWYTSFNVVSSLFPEDDFRYTPPLKRLDPVLTVRKLEKNFPITVRRRPSMFLPTETHMIVVHGDNQFYDDVWLRFDTNHTHIVSASRVGLWDANVNQNRVRRMKKLLKS